jgi:hypothetical protein
VKLRGNSRTSRLLIKCTEASKLIITEILRPSDSILSIVTVRNSVPADSVHR